MHTAAAYSRSIESVFRSSNDFTLSDDVPKFTASLVQLLDQFEAVHEVRVCGMMFACFLLLIVLADSSKVHLICMHEPTNAHIQNMCPSQELHLGASDVALSAASSDKLIALWDDEYRETIMHKDTSDPSEKPTTVRELHTCMEHITLKLH